MIKEGNGDNVVPPNRDIVEECTEGIIEKDDAMSKDASKARWQ